MPTGYPDYLRGFQQPNAMYVSPTDTLNVGAATSQGGETVTVNYRLWLADRTIYNGQFTVSPLPTRVIKTASVPMQEGFLLSVSCKAAYATSRGQTFVRLFLGNAAFGAGQPSLMLMSDYVTTAMAPGFPNGRQLGPTEGPGWLHVLTLGSPPAGSALFWSMAPNQRLRIQSFYLVLTTSAAVINRYVTLTQNSAGSFVMSVNVENAQPASTVWAYTYANGMQYNATLTGSGYVYAPVPPNWQLSGTAFDELILTAINLGVGDQISNGAASVEEWIENV